MPTPSDSKKTSGATDGAKAAVRKWRKDGDRDDQDYYHVPGGDKLDGKELGPATGKRKKA